MQAKLFTPFNREVAPLRNPVNIKEANKRAKIYVRRSTAKPTNQVQ